MHPHLPSQVTHLTTSDQGVDDAEVQLSADFIRDLAAASSNQEVIDATAAWTPRIFRADRSSIALPVSSSPGELVVYSHRGEDTIVSGTYLQIEGTVIGRAFRTGAHIRIADLEISDGTEAAPLLAAGMRSALIFPLTCRGQRLGTINLSSRTPAAFGDRHEQLLGTVASLVASFLQIHSEAEEAVLSAATDELTGELNRRAVLAELQEDLHGERRPSLLYADVDSFKAVNDAFGHAQGDLVLQELTRRMTVELGPDDSIGRLGGDEFLIIVRADPSGERALGLATRLLTACAAPLKIGEIEMNPAVSIGVATASDHSPDATHLVAEADMAMYQAKRTRSGLAVADSKMHKRARLEATIDRDLEEAFDSGSLTLFYQPVRSLTSGLIIGAEALLRWNHSDYGWIPTPLLLERIDATGRTRSLTNWTLETVATNWVTARQAVPSLSGSAVALNLSPRQLAWEDYPDAHAGALHRHGLSAPDIMIEVVESTEIQPGDLAEQTLRRIGDANVTIALDDFGTGHNALGYFTRFPIHMIKFDRSLVSSAVTNDSARIIVGGLARMARELGVVALAEGIETDAEAETCMKLDIDHGQGWHLGRPMALDSFIDLAASESGHPPQSPFHDLLH